MAFWVFGSTGMLGRQILAEGEARGHVGIGIARSGAGLNLDLCQASAWEALNELAPPRLIINTAAVTDLKLCESDPVKAGQVNAGIPKKLSEFSQKTGARIVQISTDHYYSGDGRRTHKEDEPLELLNHYAVTKAEGERHALEAKDSLVLRTNLVGFRGWNGRPTFVEWAISSLVAGQTIPGFTDFLTSSIDVRSFSSLFWDLETAEKPRGVVNLASSSVASKWEFLKALSSRFGFGEEKVIEGTLMALKGPKRGDSLGLDVEKAEQMLGRAMPDLKSVIESLWHEFESSSAIRAYLQMKQPC